MAILRRRLGRENPKVSPMSDLSTNPSIGTTSSKGVARTILVSAASRLCGTIHGGDVFNYNRCPIQVAGCSPSELSTTSAATYEKLRQTFATHGLPVVLVTDNEPNFTSHELLGKKRIKHIQSSPYQPASSGLAETVVRTFKEGWKGWQQGAWKQCWPYRSYPHPWCK